MTWRLLVVLCCVLSWTLAAYGAKEQQLARIRIGMKPREVMAVLGEPTAILMAQPPPVERFAVPGMLGSVPGMGMMSPGGTPGMPGLPTAEMPNVLILLYEDREIDLGMSGPTNTAAMMSPMMAQGTASNPEIPVWAYAVRATTLSLDQQEFIYKINDTYAVGVTITGQGAEARVTDVVATSFAPFTWKYNLATKKYEPVKNPAPNFYFTAQTEPARKNEPLLLPSGTSKGVILGKSTLAQVLRAHKWPEFFFPFVTQEITDFTLAPGALVKDVPVRGVGAAGATPGLPVPGGQGQMVAYGEKVVTFTNGEDVMITSGFTSSCLLLYLRDQVAFTLVDFVVVRIQIGEGVVKPPEPPRPKLTMPGMMR